MPGTAVVVIKAGETFPDLIAAMGNFEDWIISGLGLARAAVTVVDAEKGEALPDLKAVRGAVISGAHSMVTQDHPWSLDLEAWTKTIIDAGIPLLGICYGHQIMARAMGGAVDFHPGGTQIGTREIQCLPVSRKDPLFKDLPERFKVHVFHSQAVIRLPESAVLLAGNSFDPHQAFRLGATAWGVQFHPEATAAVTLGYIRNLEEALLSEGQNLDEIIATLGQTPHAAALLRGFGRLVTGE